MQQNSLNNVFGALFLAFFSKIVVTDFLFPISRESVVFGSNFRSGDFDGFTRFEVP